MQDYRSAVEAVRLSSALLRPYRLAYALSFAEALERIECLKQLRSVLNDRYRELQNSLVAVGSLQLAMPHILEHFEIIHTEWSNFHTQLTTIMSTSGESKMMYKTWLTVLARLHGHEPSSTDPSHSKQSTIILFILVIILAFFFF
jgi:hypothetical protein